MTSETTSPILDPADIRSLDRPAPRHTVVLAASLGIMAMAGVAFGAWTWFDRAAPRRISSVRMGPIAEMPEIRNGVPALAGARSTPASGAPAAPRLEPADPEPRRVRTVSAPPPALAPAAAASPGPDIVAANAKAMASTAASIQLRPSLGAPLVPSTAPSSNLRDAARPADPVVTAAPAPERGIASADRSVPDARRTVPSSVLVGTDPVEAAAAPTEEALPASPVATAARSPAPVQPAASPTAGAPPLPPARPAARQPAPASLERVATLQRARPAAPGPAIPAGAAASAPEQPAPERAEIFGMPLPGFVPTGRQIREAAGSVADAVVNLPDRF
ncbi:hypothetical protein [uncultured Enterovirga sp.]|uniref:hypothetical protein n=1 Tax=uncultured Enterovirga sp. TaxID=2026352 RepID=UPI0035CAF5D8